MDFSTLNWAAIAVVSVLGILIGSIWFGPKTFYPIWWKLMNDKPMPGREAGGGGAMFAATIIALVAQVIGLAIAIQVVAKAYGTPLGALDGAHVGLFLGVMVGAASSLSHRMFGRHGIKVWLIEVAPDVLFAVLAGVILATWR